MALEDFGPGLGILAQDENGLVGINNRVPSVGLNGLSKSINPANALEIDNSRSVELDDPVSEEAAVELDVPVSEEVAVEMGEINLEIEGRLMSRVGGISNSGINNPVQPELMRLSQAPGISLLVDLSDVECRSRRRQQF